MSAMMDSLLDRQRLADIATNDGALTATACIRATGNHLAAQNDEQEPRTLEAILEAGEADARAIVAQPLQLSPQDRALAEGFAGARPFAMFSEEQLLAGDRARQASKDADCASHGRLSADRAPADRPTELGRALGAQS